MGKTLNTIYLSTLLVLLPGCGDPFSNQPFEDDERFLQALPQDETLNVSEPAEGQARASVETDATETGAGMSSAGCQPSEGCNPDAPRTLTKEMIGNVNGYLKSVLTQLDRLRSQPPTERTENSRVWGPYPLEDGGYVHLEVVAELPIYRYSLRLGMDEAEQTDVLMEGVFVPGSTVKEGAGSFRYDLSVLATYSAEHSGQGQLYVDWSTLGEAVDIRLEGRQVQPEGSAIPVDESYAYYTPGDGSGRFYFEHPHNVYGGDALELVTIWSGWEADGRGRSDMFYQGGDLGFSPVTAQECWAAGTPFFYDGPNSSCDMGDDAACLASVEGWEEG